MHKNSGIKRLVKAFGYSFAGLKAGLGEAALRQEYLLAVIAVPLAYWIGSSWLEKALLAGSIFLIILTELLNTAIEKTCDRCSTDKNALTKQAKDMGSAAVFISIIIALMLWLPAIYYNL